MYLQPVQFENYVSYFVGHKKGLPFPLVLPSPLCCLPLTPPLSPLLLYHFAHVAFGFNYCPHFSGRTKFKRTHLEQAMNRLVFFVSYYNIMNIIGS